MSKQLGLRALLVNALFVAGCHDPEPAPAPPPRQEPASSSGLAQPAEELGKLDQRLPVPLLPMMAWHQKQNMMDHLIAIQRITEGLASESWDEVAKASAALETSPQMAQMCQHMGAGAAGFTEMALDFHRRADAIGKAARSHDSAAVLRATSKTLEACTGCHAAFRQEVVDTATWQARTGEVHDAPQMHGELH